MSDNHEEFLEEARRVIRVNSKGKKTRRIKCKKGFKLNKAGTGCVPQTGSEKSSKRKSVRKALKTKRQSPSTQRRASFKRKKALKRRKAQGIK